MHSKILWLIALALLALIPFFVTDTFAKKGGNKPPPPPPPSSPADPAIVYQWGVRTLKVVNSDGSNQATVYEALSSAAIYAPSWSGDGRHVSFVEEDSSLPEPNSILCRIDVDVVDGVPRGSNRTVLVDDIEVWSAAWSPLNDQIAFTVLRTPGDSSTTELRMIGAGGGSQQTLYTPPQNREVSTVTWSPEANRIAIIEHDSLNDVAELQILDLTTSGITTVEFPWEDTDVHTRRTAWAKTQDVFACVTVWEPRIHLLDLTTGETQVLGTGETPSWSPDDSQIVFRGSVQVGKGKNKYEYGIVKYTLATGEKELLVEGTEARHIDWKR